MVKRQFFWASGTFLVLAGSAFLYSNLSRGREVVAEIDSLIAKSEGELEPCHQFKTKLREFSREEQSYENAAHASKEEALAVLTLLESYPGMPPSSRQAAQLFYDHFETLARRVDQYPLAVKFTHLHPECEVFAMHTHSRLLLKDMDTFAFLPAEKARVRQMLSHYLRSDQPSHTLISVMIRGVLLHGLLQKMPKPDQALIARAKNFMELSEQKREAITEKLNAAGKWSLYFLSGFDHERKVVRELSQEYNRLLADSGL